MFAKALRRAEVFLEQVDETVAQASRRLAVEGATGYDEDEYATDEDSADSSQPRRRAAHIAKAIDPNVTDQVPPQQSKGESATLVPSTSVAENAENVVNQIVAQIVEPRHNEPSMTTYSEDNNANISEEDVSKPDVHSKPPRLPQVSRSAPGAIEKLRANVEGTTKEVQASASEDGSNVTKNAAANFLMGITKVRETAGSLLGEAMLDDNQYINELQKENSELRKELEQLEEDFEELRKERNKMVKNLKRMKEIVTEMDESLREKSGEARLLDAQLVEAKDALAKLREAMEARNMSDKKAMEKMHNKLTAQLVAVRESEVALKAERSSLSAENHNLREAVKSGQDLENAISTGARKEAIDAHHKYEAEVAAHRETKRLVKEREESLEEQAALAAKALAAAERKADECLANATMARSAQRVAESKLGGVVHAREAAFARLADLERDLRRYEGDGGAVEEREALQTTVSELENALEAKNVELNRLEGEVEALKDALAARREMKSPRSPAMRSAMPHSAEVEQKLRHMADASLRKQAQLEVLRSENRALQHQLDTERKRTREAQAMAAAASSSRQSIRGGFRGILEADEEGGRHYGVRDGPLARFRAPRNWPRQIVRAINAVDQVSAQALGFLRKEPVLRIVLLLYAFMVHIYLWNLLRYHADAITRSADAAGAAVAKDANGALH